MLTVPKMHRFEKNLEYLEVSSFNKLRIFASIVYFFKIGGSDVRNKILGSLGFLAIKNYDAWTD